jgi:hypothetical protein
MTFIFEWWKQYFTNERSPEQKIVKFHAQKQIGKSHVIDIFTSEDMENISLCIFQYLTLYYIINSYIYHVDYSNVSLVTSVLLFAATNWNDINNACEFSNVVNWACRPDFVYCIVVKNTFLNRKCFCAGLVERNWRIFWIALARKQRYSLH